MPAPRPANALRLALATLLGAAAMSCTARLLLDPRFAPRAQALPVSVTAGFWPNDPLVIGDVTFAHVRFEDGQAVALDVGPFHRHIGSLGWRLTFGVSTAGRAALPAVCVGERDPRPAGDLPPDPVVCTFGDAASGWTMSLIERSGYAGEIRYRAQALGVEPAARLLGKAYVGDVQGFYVRRDGTIEGAIDTTFVGQPRVWVARDLPADVRAVVVVALGTLHFLMSKPSAP